jgi:hypothetical protein
MKWYWAVAFVLGLLIAAAVFLAVIYVATFPNPKIAEAQIGCAAYQAHAEMIGGEVYCARTFAGTDYLVPLEELQKQEPSGEQNDG